MSLFFVSILLVIVSQVAYQLAQKTIPGSAHPMVLLTIVYLIAATVSAGVAALMDRPTGGAWRQALGWPTYLLALSVVGIEAGYLLAYRNGWTLGTTYAFSSATTVVILTVIGIAVFREPLSPRQLLGVGLALTGGWLIVAKP